jgi:hypothetical protein
MDAITEHFFLDELTYLCAAAISHAEALENASSAWLDADRQLKALQSREGSWSLQESEADRLAVEKRIQAQNEVFRRIESFVGVHGRIIDILQPDSYKKKPPTAVAQRKIRATHLRALLRIKAGQPLLDKRLRNAWTHFDEILDAGCIVDPEKVNPQRVCLRKSEATDTQTLRLIVIDELQVRVLGHGEYDLRSQFSEIRTLYTAVGQAISNWGTRWSSRYP